MSPKKDMLIKIDDIYLTLVGNVGDMSPTCLEMSVLLVNFEKMCLCPTPNTFFAESRVKNVLPGPVTIIHPRPPSL